MKEFIESINTNNLLEDIDTVYVAVSGGSDSMVLLALFNKYRDKYKINIKVIHIHHGIRLASDKEAEFVKNWCDTYNITCIVRKVDMNLPELKGRSLEERGRILRYKVFKEYLINNQTVVALAHHQADQGETILLNIFRGSGLKGLGGMLAKRGQYIRPLLDVPKSTILEYIKNNKLEYVEDTSNKDMIYTRNYLRHKLIPMIEKHLQPKISDHLGEMAKQLQKEEHYMETQMLQKLEKVVIESKTNRYIIDRKEFLKIEPVIMARIFRHIISKLPNGLNNVTSIHHNNFIKFVLKGSTGKVLELPGDRVIKCDYNNIILEMKSYNKDSSMPIVELILNNLSENKILKVEDYILEIKQYDGKESYPEKRYTKWLDYDKIGDKLLIRSRQSGDFFYYNIELNKKKIKNYLMDLKISRDKRNEIPMLVDEKEVLWIVGYRINERFKISASTKQVLEITYLRKER